VNVTTIKGGKGRGKGKSPISHMTVEPMANGVMVKTHRRAKPSRGMPYPESEDESNGFTGPNAHVDAAAHVAQTMAPAAPAAGEPGEEPAGDENDQE